MGFLLDVHGWCCWSLRLSLLLANHPPRWSWLFPRDVIHSQHTAFALRRRGGHGHLMACRQGKAARTIRHFPGLDRRHRTLHDWFPRQPDSKIHWDFPRSRRGKRPGSDDAGVAGEQHRGRLSTCCLYCNPHQYEWCWWHLFEHGIP